MRALTSPDEAYFEIEQLLEQNADDVDINASDPVARITALHLAASLGLDSLIHLLIFKGGADVGLRDAEGRTPLHVAAKNGKKDVLYALLLRRSPTTRRRIRDNKKGGASSGADNDANDTREEGDEEEEADEDIINSVDKAGFTPLALSILEGKNPEASIELLYYGANPNLRIFGDGTAVHLATLTPGMETVAIEAVRHGGDVAITDRQLNTPLHLAAQLGNWKLVEFFMTQRPDLATMPNAAGETPQQCALRFGHTAAASALGGWALRKAVQSGDVSGMVAAISAGADFKCPLDGNGNTALHYLVERGESDALERLSQVVDERELVGTVMSTQNSVGNSPVHIAAQLSNADMLQSLLSIARRQSDGQAGEANNNSMAHALATAVNNEGLSSLHVAARYGRTAAANELLNEAPALISVGDSDTLNTPLHYAASEGHLPMVELLLARGADVNARNRLRETPLHLAANWNEVAVVQRLLECGADSLAVDEEGTTPQDRATAQGHIALWEAMLANRLRRAAASGDLPALESSLKDGASVDYQDDSTERDTGLHTAAKAGHVEAIRMLLSNSPNPSHTLRLLNRAGDGVVHAAARAGKVEALEALLQFQLTHGNSEEVPWSELENGDGDTPLHVAVAEGWTDVVTALVQRCGADVDRPNTTRGATALLDAAGQCNLGMVTCLLGLGADPNVTDAFYHNTALHLLAMWGRPDESGGVAEVLVKAGADPFARNVEGKTARALALAADHSSMVEKLPVCVDDVAVVGGGGVGSGLGSGSGKAKDEGKDPATATVMTMTNGVVEAQPNRNKNKEEEEDVVFYPTIYDEIQPGAEVPPPPVPPPQPAALTPLSSSPVQQQQQVPHLHQQHIINLPAAPTSPCIPLHSFRATTQQQPAPASPFARLPTTTTTTTKTTTTEANVVPSQEPPQSPPSRLKTFPPHLPTLPAPPAPPQGNG